MVVSFGQDIIKLKKIDGLYVVRYNSSIMKKGVYSNETKEKWINFKPKLTGKELLINSYQIMQRWEDNYMKSLSSIATSRGGNVLEVGFGMGISAGYIQRSKKIKSHVIIECHPDIIANAKKMFASEMEDGRLKILKGFWEDITIKLKGGSFDGILFDSCPLDSGVDFFQFLPFFKEAYRLLRDGGIFTYFSDETKEISALHRKELTNAGFKNIKSKVCHVHPPKHCKYWKHNTIITPIIIK